MMNWCVYITVDEYSLLYRSDFRNGPPVGQLDVWRFSRIIILLFVFIHMDFSSARDKRMSKTKKKWLIANERWTMSRKLYTNYYVYVHGRSTPALCLLVPLESHFSRQYAPLCLMDINLLESISISQGKRCFFGSNNVKSAIE
jgi:hypothetical protein